MQGVSGHPKRRQVKVDCQLAGTGTPYNTSYNTAFPLVCKLLAARLALFGKKNKLKTKKRFVFLCFLNKKKMSASCFDSVSPKNSEKLQLLCCQA